MTSIEQKLRQAEEKFALGELSQAKSLLEDILENDPGNCEAQNNLGVVAWQMGDLEAAQQWLRKAARQGSSVLDAHLNLTSLLRAQGRRVEAFSVALEALRLFPEQEEIQQVYDDTAQELILHVAELGDLGEGEVAQEGESERQAVQALRGQLDGFEERFAACDLQRKLAALAIVFLLLGKRTEAKRCTRELCGLPSAGITAFLLLGKLHLADFEVHEARFVLGKALQKFGDDDCAARLLRQADSLKDDPRVAERYRRILLVMDEGIGNMVMLTPAIRALKEQMPQSEITVLGRPPALEVVDGWQAVASATDRLGDDEYDVCFYCIWYARTREQLGQQLAARCRSLFEFTLANRGIHEADQQMRIAQFFGYEGPTPEPHVQTREPGVDWPADRPVVALSDTTLNNGHWERKRWPYYHELAQHLVSRGFAVALIGGAGEAERFAEESWPEGVIDLQGKLTLAETAAVLRRCALFVGNDSGPAHLSAAVGTRTLVLFGPTLVSKNHPKGPQVKVLAKGLACSPCQYTPRWQECTDWRCMSELSVDEVFQAAIEWLENNAEERASAHVAAASSTNGRLQLVSKEYTACDIVDQEGVKYLRRGDILEPLTIHLVGARWANFPWGMENEMFRALEKMGFDVFDTDYRLQRENFEELFLRPAHMLLVFKGSGIPPELIRRYPGRTVLWYQDDIFATEHAPRDIAHNAHAFDTVYSFDRSALEEYRKLGVRDARWLPLAMSPAVHRKLFLPKEQDVVFVGNVYPNRAALLERLQKRFNVLVTKAYMDEMVRLFNQARIVLNLGIGNTGIQSRVFEALGCGSFLLTNEIPHDTRLFEDRKHLVYFNDDNIEELIDHYLNHEEERESIALAGYRKAHAEHTYEHRVEQLIREQITEAKSEKREGIRVVTTPSTARGSKGPRILVVGFDGMEANILLDNLDEFPTFKGLMAESSWGTLEVTPVPGTLEGWASIYTGCEPSRHGMDETAWKKSGGEIEDFPKFADLRVKTIWEMFAEDGRTAGCFNIPFVHYMPQRHQDLVRYIVPGCFVPAHIRPYPRKISSLLEDYPTEQGSVLSPKPQVPALEWSEAKGRHQRWLKRHYVREAMGRDVRRLEYCKRLIREFEPHFVFNVFHETDRIGHFVFDYLDLMVEGYRIADEILAEMMELDYDYIVVISDHGMWYQDSELCERTVNAGGTREFASGGYRLADSAHSAHAIFIISGEGIAAGRRVEGSLYDVTPTLCHLAGVPMPEETDGRVLNEIFAGQVLDEEEKEHLKEQLAGLGYI